MEKSLSTRIMPPIFKNANLIKHFKFNNKERINAAKTASKRKFILFRFRN